MSSATNERLVLFFVFFAKVMSAKSVATLNVVLFYFLTLVMDVGEFLLAEGVLKAVCLCKTSTSITKPVVVVCIQHFCIQRILKEITSYVF